MGAWDHDLLSNDTASDFVGDVVEFIKEVIEKDLKSLQQRTSRSILLRKTAPAVVTLVVLCKGIPSARFSLEEKDVKRWRDVYMAWVNEYFVKHYDDPKQAVRLRAKLIKAFDDLQRLIKA